MSLVDHRKSFLVVTAADSSDVADVSIVDDFQVRLFRVVVEILDEFFALWKQLASVGAEPFGGLFVADFSDERVPVVTKIELHIRFARVTFVDTDQRVVAWIPLKEASCSHYTNTSGSGSG